MRNYPLLSLAVAGLTTVSVSAATYVSDFTGLDPGDPLDGFGGWNQSDPNFSDGEVYPWAFGSTINGNPAAAVGGFFNTDPPPSGSFYVFQTLSLTSGMDFQMSFSMIDSDPFEIDGTVYGEARNRFNIGFYNVVGAEIFSIVFDPNTDEENPDPLLNPFDTWNVSSSSGGLQTSATMAVIEGGFYTLQLSLRPSAGNLNYNYSLISSVNTQSSTGIHEGVGSGEISEMRVGIWATGGGLGSSSQLGTNFLAFEGINAAIPEPSSLLLIGFTFGGAALLRKRR